MKTYEVRYWVPSLSMTYFVNVQAECYVITETIAEFLNDDMVVATVLNVIYVKEVYETPTPSP